MDSLSCSHVPHSKTSSDRFDRSSGRWVESHRSRTVRSVRYSRGTSPSGDFFSRLTLPVQARRSYPLQQSYRVPAMSLSASQRTHQHRRSQPRRFNSSYDHRMRGNAPKLRSELADTAGAGAPLAAMRKQAWQNRSETTGSTSETARAIAGLHKACYPRKQLHHSETH